VFGAEEDVFSVNLLLVPVGLVGLRRLDFLPVGDSALGASLSGSATASSGLSSLSNDFLEVIQFGLESNEVETWFLTISMGSCPYPVQINLMSTLGC
jgi:hypothetical protein